ncbi:pyridine nucleotide-disulfide oxidoreductase [Kushneria pakistanensis]|uniref:Pyridine nucleotide-disulfide oxidoreductase n=1 Tax=Kushneria pakistanensis TaxID=1508770 RepID=A0ABQ3FIH4_9GAMM|nr:FAD/NAD(P)-binding oxidoreductase [Kushneria pakistanensis]GHC25785.1 pyridine nucleotide-disulfide oxidoreductase [Kushneria pakistanensis]
MTGRAPQVREVHHDVVVIGAGAAGIAIAQGIRRRAPRLNIAIIDPADHHYYQPGWTLVGGGVFEAESTRRAMADVLPGGMAHYAQPAVAIDPDKGAVLLGNGRSLYYRALVVAPGLELDWDAVEGLPEALGQYGVTSNYRFDLAPYTWSLVQGLRRGKALFTQPPMPIKCAGAPQKAMYLACDHWQRRGVLGDIDVSFHNAGGALFGVPAYIPALMAHVERYGINLAFHQQLVAVDGPNRQAHFMIQGADSRQREHVESFDMLHVVPPQRAPALIRDSRLANDAGWLDLHPNTLQHQRYPSIFGAGDVSATLNAKTAAAVRVQAPIVADNVVAYLQGRELSARYQGYGACPLTVSRGRVVLAEFGYGGELMPTLPGWLNDGQRATSLAWQLKAYAMPTIYWQMMLKGREWMVS